MMAENIPAAIKPVAHGGYPDAEQKPDRRPIILQIAKASDDHEMWERRFAAISGLMSWNKAPEFADRDGKWSMAELLTYMASACGWKAAR